MSLTVDFNEAAILDRVIRPDSAGWPEEVAKAILEIKFDGSDLERMTVLLEKANSSGLNEEENTILENYQRVGRLLELMKSRARRSLQRRVG